MSRLSPRPVGVRKSWRRSTPSPADAHAALVRFDYSVGKDDEPVEAQMFTDRRGQVRRIEVAYADGSSISLRRTEAGDRVVHTFGFTL